MIISLVICKVGYISSGNLFNFYSHSILSTLIRYHFTSFGWPCCSCDDTAFEKGREIFHNAQQATRGKRHSSLGYKNHAMCGVVQTRRICKLKNSTILYILFFKYFVINYINDHYFSF